MTDAPSVSKLAGQLVYMFEDDPALRDTPVEQLRDRLALEDRIARARHTYPNDNDAEIQARLGEFDDRVTTADFVDAIAEARRRLDDFRAGTTRPSVRGPSALTGAGVGQHHSEEQGVARPMVPTRPFPQAATPGAGTSGCVATPCFSLALQRAVQSASRRVGPN
jgi:hypothetical protein